MSGNKGLKKLFSILVVVFMMYALCSCFTSNGVYSYNKKVLDTYETNDKYGILSRYEYEYIMNNKSKVIKYEELVLNRARRDGKETGYHFNTSYRHTLVNNNLYFVSEYGGTIRKDIHAYAIGYFDFATRDLYMDYFESEERAVKYLFSTDKFICYRVGEKEYTYVVFFKEDNKLVFDYDINQLVYNQEDIEENHLKDYYIENGVKYEINYSERKLVNNELDVTIQLPIYNEIMDKAPIIKDIYDKFKYDGISMLLTYISTGDELFFYIHDRPTNSLNAPFMLFKCDATFSNVTYIGYCDDLIEDVIRIK